MSQGQRNFKKFESLKGKVHEIYEFRNMIRAQVTRNLFGRYKNTALGFAWNFVTPMIYIVMCYIIYTEIRQKPIENFFIFVSSGIFMYTFILGSISGGGALFTSNAGMIKKIYFPKEILAISKALTAIIITSLGYLFVYLLVFIIGAPFNPISIPAIILMLLLGFIFYIGCSLFFGSISVYIRDVQYFLSSMTMVFFVCTPIRRMMSDADGLVLQLYTYNPLTYFIEPMHQAIFEARVPDLWYVGLAALIAFIALIIGYVVFLNLKHGFVERL